MKVLLWIVAIFVLLVAAGNIYKGANSSTAVALGSSPTVIPDLPSQHLTLAKSSWRKGGFNSVAFGTFAVKNDNAVPVKDIEIACDFFGKSGTRINSGDATIYDTAPPKKTKTFPEVSLGFIDQQVTSMSCDIVGAD